MLLYHGTNIAEPIIGGEMSRGTWLAGKIHHALRIAELRAMRRGGIARVLELEIPSINLIEITDRNESTYRYNGGGYKPLNEVKVMKIKLKGENNNE